ncbi:hypothetical protein PFISCL1PPCAC_2518, partial [Pristionchus fissidentatus]
RYASIVLGWPRLTILLTLSISIGLSIWGGVRHWDVVDFTPSKGFETRGTHWSDIRLALTNLPDFTASRAEMIASGKRTKRKKRALEAVRNYSNAEDVEPFTINYDDYGVNSNPRLSDVQEDPCVQYAGLGTDLPYEFVDLFAKMTFEYKSLDQASFPIKTIPTSSLQLFSLEPMRSLCYLDATVDGIEGKKTVATKLTYSFTLPLYSTCLNMSSYKTCDALNQRDLDHLRKTLLTCKDGTNPDKDLCSMKIVTQAISYLLPKDLSNPYFNVILPLYTSSSDASFDYFMELKRRVISELSEHFTLRGTYFFTKDKEFMNVLTFDCILGGVSALLVFFVLLLIVQSFLFTLSVLLLLILSFTLAFYFYTCLLGFPFFPFVNLISLALMIYLAADDALLLVVFYRHERRARPLISPEEVFSHSLPHSLGSVTVTSVTTAIAFLVNLTSDVLIMRCFGVFASLIVLSNLLLLYLLLPPCLFLTIHRVPLHPFPSFVSAFFSSFSHHLSIWTNRLRWSLSLLFLLIAIASSIVIFVVPSLQLPETVNVQLLRPDHTEEWFDRNAKLFDFSANRKFTLIENVVLGVNPVKDASLFNPYSNGHVTFDSSFAIDTYEDLNRMKNLSTYLLARSKLRPDTALWLDLFKMWINSTSCTEECCYRDDKAKLNSTCFLQYSRRFPVSTFPSDWTTFPIDGPIFTKDLKFVGYFFGFPSAFKWSLDWDILRVFFDDMDVLQGRVREYMPGDSTLVSTSTQILRIYDLLARSLPSTLLSLAIALSSCLILVFASTRKILLTISTIFTITFTLLVILAVLVFMGWRLGVIESSIIVLATGVAFDYVLHYAVAYRMSPNLPFPALIRQVHNSAGAAVLGGTATSLAASLPLLFASTSAFSQLGIFLLLVSVLSLLSACLVFPSLHSVIESVEETPRNLKF